jgi:serine/threonine-protein kinase
MASATGASRRASDGNAPASGEDARAFFQERLAFLGKAYLVIAVGFYLLANVASSARPGYRWSQLVTDLTNLLVLAASAIYGVQWLVCRRGRLSEPALTLLDGTSATLVAACNACMVFAPFPGEAAGLSYSRALLLFTFGVIGRAVVVPSSARRTLLLGLVASSFPVAATYMWFEAHGLGGGSPVLTALWCLGAVVIASLASRVIFGLRQQVREAWQLGQYTLLEKIGEGGMGAVYRASHAMLRRPTAIKLLPPGRAGVEHLQRFEREVQLTSRLTHPNTVAIFDYGRTPDGVFYYAMEYLEGLTLEDLVQFDGPQPPGRVVHVLRQVAGSLAEAHGVGLIHRDVKPANVILVAERGGAPDVAKVVDFGLVKELDEGPELSDAHQMAGTPLYLSPEAIASPERVDGRSDLYSLGCVGYYLLSGLRVFEGRTVAEVCSHHLHSPAVPPGQRVGRPVPESLSALLMACLEKEPERRPASARAFLRALGSCRDIAPWTEDEARAWWMERGAAIIARLRSGAGAEGREGARTVVSTGLGTASFIRPAGAPPEP